jgi:SAM-dependent methyltransferase
MSSGFRSDLFKGTAYYYQRFRPGYPDALIADLLERVSGRACLLDVACGTGQISIPFAREFEEVLGLDQEAEMIELARKLRPDISWFTGAIESFRTDKRFDLITIGNAFHRLDRHEVARRAYRWLKPGAPIAILWANGPWTEGLDWQRDLAQKIERWEQRLADGRVPNGWREDIHSEPTATVLERHSHVYEGRFEFPATKVWTLESIVGYARSTSTLKPLVLGDHADEFATDIRKIGPGPFVQQTTAAYEIARKRND